MVPTFFVQKWSGQEGPFSDKVKLEEICEANFETFLDQVFGTKSNLERDEFVS
jgi:hypothetical protein